MPIQNQQTEETEIDSQPVKRDVTLRFFRHEIRSDSIIIMRNDVHREYRNPNRARYDRIAKIIRNNRIQLDIDLYSFTEITFQADKE
jgi:hypothetical protein